MAFDDDTFGVFFPTRHGEVVGRGLENRMLQNVGGAMGIRQKIIDLPDGTTVRLRTRAGMPEFIAEKPKGSALFYSHNIAYVTAGARLLSPTPSINLTGEAISFDRLMDTFRCDGTVATLSPTVSVNMDGSARLALTCKMFETDYYPVGAALGTDAEGAAVIYTGNVYHGTLTFEPTTFLPLIDGESPPENSYRAVGAFTDYGSYEVSPLLNRVDTDARVYWLYQKLGTAYGQDFMYYPTTFYWNITGDDDAEISCEAGRTVRNYALVVGGYTGILTDPNDISHTYRYDWVNGLRTYPTYICDDDTRYIMVAYLSTTTTHVFVTLHVARTPDKDTGVVWQKVLDGQALPLDLSNYKGSIKTRIKAALQFSPSNRRILIEVKRSVYDAVHVFEVVLSGGDEITPPDATIALHKKIGVTQQDVVPASYTNTAFTTYTVIDVPEELLVEPTVRINSTDTTNYDLMGDVVEYENYNAGEDEVVRSGYRGVQFLSRHIEATAYMSPMVSTYSINLIGAVIIGDRRVWVEETETTYIGAAYSKDDVPNITVVENFSTMRVDAPPSVEMVSPSFDVGGGGCRIPWTDYISYRRYGPVEDFTANGLSLDPGIYGIATEARVVRLYISKVIRNELTLFETHSEAPSRCDITTYAHDGGFTTIDGLIEDVKTLPRVAFTTTKIYFPNRVGTPAHWIETLGLFSDGYTSFYTRYYPHVVIEGNGGHRRRAYVTASRHAYNFGRVVEHVVEWDETWTGANTLDGVLGWSNGFTRTNITYSETAWLLPFDEDFAPVLMEEGAWTHPPHFNPKTGEFSTDGSWWC